MRAGEDGDQGMRKKVKNKETRKPPQRNHAEESESHGKKSHSAQRFFYSEGLMTLLRDQILEIVCHIGPFYLPISNLSL